VCRRPDGFARGKTGEHAGQSGSVCSRLVAIVRQRSPERGLLPRMMIITSKPIMDVFRKDAMAFQDRNRKSCRGMAVGNYLSGLSEALCRSNQQAHRGCHSIFDVRALSASYTQPVRDPTSEPR
jgi:hypothetical protein